MRQISFTNSIPAYSASNKYFGFIHLFFKEKIKRVSEGHFKKS